MGWLSVTIRALDATGDCEVKIAPKSELTDEMKAYGAACDSLDALVWGEAPGAAQDCHQLPEWVSRCAQRERKKRASEARIMMPKAHYWDKDMALFKRVDPELEAVKRVAVAKARPKQAAAPLPPGAVQTHCGNMDPSECDMPRDKHGATVYSLRSRDYARFFRCLANGCIPRSFESIRSDQRTAFLKAYISGMEDRAGVFFEDALCGKSNLPPEAMAELDREFERLLMAQRLDKRRVERLLKAQSHLPEAQRRDDSYESHLDSARRWPAWLLARRARASNADILAQKWSETFRRAVADAAVERQTELDAIPVGAEEPERAGPC